YKIPPATIKQFNGAGVDSQAFAYIDRAEKPELIIGMASRLLWPKGVGHFVEAVQMLKQKGINGIKCRFVLIGAPDEDNPYHVPPAQLQAWHDAGIIDYWGYKADMPDILAQLDILCLPTFYGEGVPKILIEGAATGLPLIAYNVAGCDVIIDNMQNGILVPPKNIQAIAQAIVKLIKDSALRLEMGKRGRAKIEQDFTAQKINEETLLLWRELLA
ncbi:MAG: glycosyltransferase, partial [Alphaproteobacteria bacterium]|nr:glycosyltransferase [Alphaproteobacteria bacterium]